MTTTAPQPLVLRNMLKVRNVCPVCESTFFGKSSAVYCSNRCKQKAKYKRQKASVPPEVYDLRELSEILRTLKIQIENAQTLVGRMSDTGYLPVHLTGLKDAYAKFSKTANHYIATHDPRTYDQEQEI